MYIPENDKPPLLPFIVISILIHMLILLILGSGLFKIPKTEEQVVEIIPVIEKGQQYEIADISKPDVEQRPDKARFVGNYDSSANKETVAVTQRGGSQQAQRKTEKAKTPVKEPKSNESKSKSYYNIDKKLFASKTPDVLDSQEISDIRGTNSLEDYYPDYTIGARTYLNVLRYPDVDYFVRMKRQFKMTFNPVPALKDYFSMNRVMQGSVDVVMGVSVNPSGNLAELFVIRSSGISEYDKEALRTVRASSPFASPPKKFLEDDGMLRMCWTFTVYL
ncbi:MAG: hypothetical protein COS89_05035 [Deltaproteobacteria bacterium CG07_land_8_20_14_0_80_38_7]|nr:MAG: hypothetical protein COS89_05035 [Deltaproteobacteria bacterium CG07_land_8_20_14_0_80_38_7]